MLLAREAFATALRHPYAMPLFVPAGRTVATYRRVIVWHFAFLYRVDEAARLLVVERIFHERAGRDEGGL